ncbi:Glycosyltransferase [Vibrio coralliirubri]|uniref:glycosyltransferase family 2 protein n=1 Tax=Vibrio TaxID=662 RepID=UPI00063292EA|nr:MULTISPECIES: glycosyltransferase family 2 protein [Vibrio]MCK8085000.1 glycosyltransferase family 2 protein [Vibrio sp. 1CM8B]CDT85021.1 Glycosyltransferase [Vibrio coralliirubri]
MNKQKVAILLPCYNEAGAIGETVTSFQQALPDASIYVYDNNSTDNTVNEALQAGAIVRHEPRQGKGEVVRRMFSDIDADIYVMADGDDTYDASICPELIDQLNNEKLDMIIGSRERTSMAYPKGHILGNKMFSSLINLAFNAQLNDVFSGYRIMSHRFVKTAPIFSDGFQIETELTVHALHHNMSIKEVSTQYQSRPEGTTSKLNTLSDGLKILNFILFLLRDVKPMFFFGSLSILLGFISLILGIPVIVDFVDTGLVERLPTAVLSSSIALIAVMSFFCGLILDNVSRGRREMRILSILRFKDDE